MDESETSQNDERPAGQDAPAGSPAEVTDSGEAAELSGTGSTPESGQDSAPAGPRRTGSARGARIAAYVAAAALALGAGFGLTKLVDPPRAASLASSDIPSPAKSVSVFTEDDNGTGQDNESNIFASTVPGLVHVISAGKAVGIGLVLTPSGKVLTTYQPSGGGGLSAKYVLSGKTFKATVLGTDAAAGLALLQMQGS